MATTYEWDIELVDAESGDILDHNHADKLTQYSEIEIWHALTRFVDDKGEMTRLVLVRDSRFTISRGFSKGQEGLDRTWAYVTEAMQLPATFDPDNGGSPDGHKVPARFVAELADAIAYAKESLGHD